MVTSFNTWQAAPILYWINKPFSSGLQYILIFSPLTNLLGSGIYITVGIQLINFLGNFFKKMIFLLSNEN